MVLVTMPRDRRMDKQRSIGCQQQLAHLRIHYSSLLSGWPPTLDSKPPKGRDRELRIYQRTLRKQ